MSVATDHTLTLADLESWNFRGTALAVLGHPVGHSLSPVMHNAALTELAKTHPQFRDWRYFKFEIAPAAIPEALAQFHAQGFLGLNLTVPHKSLVLDLLTTADDFVRTAGAANTLTRTTAGWQGDNTDGYGLATALATELNSTLRHAAVILLGAGGAARGAALECIRAGCSTLWIGNRTTATAEALLASLAPQPGTSSRQVFDLAHPPANLPKNAIVINATSLGLKPGDSSPVDLAKIPRPRCVYDMIYRPAQTPLLRQAATLDLPHANGLSMLVHQGARSLQIWTGVNPPVAVMQAAVRGAL